jgi:hypothetical protein
MRLARPIGGTFGTRARNGPAITHGGWPSGDTSRRARALERGLLELAGLRAVHQNVAQLVNRLLILLA